MTTVKEKEKKKHIIEEKQAVFFLLSYNINKNYI